MTKKIDIPLTIKYEPKDFSELRLPLRLKNIINENKDRTGYRFLLYGSPGLGKTTMAKLLAKGCDVLYLSGSNDFGVDVMRNKVYPFASQNSVMGKPKICIIDEAENMSNKIQDAFKITLDQAKTVSFIFITNEVEKMNSAVMSRCTQLEFNFIGNELKEAQNYYVDFALKVCKSENIKFTNPGLKALYLKNFPDFRHLLVDLQQFKDSNLEITPENINETMQGTENIALYELLNIVEPDKFYTAASAFKGKERECFESLGEPYFRYLNNQGKFDATLKCAVIVAKYANMHTQTILKFSNLMACLQELRTILR